MGREPLTPIANNNRIHNTLDETTRSRHNTLDILDDSSLHLNTRPRPWASDRLNSTPPLTPRSNNTRMNFNNDSDNAFRLNTPNMLRSNTSVDVHSTFRTSYNAESTLPGPFREMDNIYQICSWLCANQSILLLAYNMHLSMQTPAGNALNFISPNFNSAIVPQVSNQDKVKSRDFLEELKCLFLRVRKPKKGVFEDLVRKMFNCDLNSTEGIDWLSAAKKSFNDFRNKFLDAVEEEIDNFKEKR